MAPGDVCHAGSVWGIAVTARAGGYQPLKKEFSIFRKADMLTSAMIPMYSSHICDTRTRITDSSSPGSTAVTAPLSYSSAQNDVGLSTNSCRQLAARPRCRREASAASCRHRQPLSKLDHRSLHYNLNGARSSRSGSETCPRREYALWIRAATTKYYFCRHFGPLPCIPILCNLRPHVVSLPSPIFARSPR